MKLDKRRAAINENTTYGDSYVLPTLRHGINAGA